MTGPYDTPIDNSQLDLGAAYEAGAAKLAAFLGRGPLTVQDTDRFANGAAGMIVDAAMPRILEALANKAEGEWELVGITGKGRLEGWQAAGAARWLRAEAARHKEKEA